MKKYDKLFVNLALYCFTGIKYNHFTIKTCKLPNWNGTTYTIISCFIYLSKRTHRLKIKVKPK